MSSHYLILKEGIGGEFEPLGTFNGITPEEAFKNFLADTPDFEGEAEIIQLGATFNATRYGEETTIKEAGK